jgi:osmotically-inducible protein OsmY
MTRPLARLALAALLVPGLQACVPVVATGVGAAALMAADRRTTGIYIEDENIEWKVVGRMKDDTTGSHVNATSFNRRVLITGETPTEATKKQIEDNVRSIPNVREVVDELQIGGVSSMTARGNDGLITSNVKARMVNNPKFSPNHIKVVTEANVVYLMGLVTPEEADAATEVARTTQGVSRVVKVFEYLR